MSDNAAEPSFGVYVHWPFCAQKCPYCDFNSHVRFNGWDEARFLAAYQRELDWVAHTRGASPEPVGSIFFGGGTPSLMQPRTVGAILDHIARLWPVAADAEITLEANPGSVEADRFQGYRTAGVNRVSMGLQSLRDDELKRLGRIHTVAEAKAALTIAKQTFERISFDLIYARPGQTPQAWREELAEALALARDHISLYQLTIEPDTPYAALHAAGKLIVPDADAARDLYEITQEMTGARGLAPYEISNHAVPGAESRHNLLYWRYGEYAGVGPGAHGRLLARGRGPGVRLATVAERHPETWVQRVEADGHGLIEVTELSPAEQADEMLLMGLRLSEGVDLERLARLGGVRPSARAITDLASLGLIERVASPATASRTSRLPLDRDEIAMCLSPGMGPDRSWGGEASDDASGQGPMASDRNVTGQRESDLSARIRATPSGRFVLNAVVAKLSRGFEPVAASPTMDTGQRGA